MGINKRRILMKSFSQFNYCPLVWMGHSRSLNNKINRINRIIFFMTENWICTMTRHHADPNINILLTRNHSFDSDVRQWSQLLMIPSHCFWAKSNNRPHGQFKCDATWFCFCFVFVRSQVRRGCCSIVCLRFQVVQVK